MSIYSFPNQRIAESKKDMEWHKQHIMGYLSYSSSDDYALKKKEIRDLYYAYSAQLSVEEDKKIRAMITERCGENFGPQYVVYPLIEAKIEELVGKYRKRPLKRKCLVNNEKAVIKKLDAKIDLISEKILREVNKEMQSSLGFTPETPQPEITIPPDIEEFFSKDYRTISEEVTEDILYQNLLVRKEKEKIFECLKHYLISGRVFSFLDEKEGHPSIFIPHVLDCFYDIDPNETVQKDLNLFSFDKYMSINDIYNTFELDLNQKNIIENYSNAHSTNSEMSGTSNLNWYKKEGTALRPRVVSMMWKSRKKVRFKVIENQKTKKEEYKILKEGDKTRNRDSIKMIEIDDVRHITMIGPDIVLSYGSLENQLKTVGSPKKRFLPVVGMIDDNTIGTGEIRSLAKKLVYLQDFASEILYEIRLNMRQIDGNAMVYDLANIPKEWMKFGAEKALEKVNYYLKRDRIQIINSRDKRANPYASSVNVSQRGRMQELTALLGLIEDLSDKISGIKSGQNPYQKATVAEISYEQHSDRIEEYFGIFDTFVETLLERLVLKAKHIYKENEVFTYFGGDNQMQFLQIFPDFFIDDLGIYIGDNRKEYERKKRIDEIAQQTFGNAQSPELMLDLIKIWNADGSTEAESILDRGVKALNKLKEENNKAQQEIAQQQAEQEQVKSEGEAELKREGYQKDIEVAKIYANSKADDTREKEVSSNLRKMADIEKDLAIKSQDENQDENDLKEEI